MIQDRKTVKGMLIKLKFIRGGKKYGNAMIQVI